MSGADVPPSRSPSQSVVVSSPEANRYRWPRGAHWNAVGPPPAPRNERTGAPSSARRTSTQRSRSSDGTAGRARVRATSAPSADTVESATLGTSSRSPKARLRVAPVLVATASARVAPVEAVASSPSPVPLSSLSAPPSPAAASSASTVQRDPPSAGSNTVWTISR